MGAISSETTLNDEVTYSVCRPSNSVQFKGVCELVYTIDRLWYVNFDRRSKQEFFVRDRRHHFPRTHERQTSWGWFKQLMRCFHVPVSWAMQLGDREKSTVPNKLSHLGIKETGYLRAVRWKSSNRRRAGYVGSAL